MEIMLKTSLIGKINNLPPFKNEALLPLFEAVANSIQAIEERDNISSGQITIEIIRDKQRSFEKFDADKSKVIGFAITDNGIGFDDLNYDSFLTADTTHKLEKGGKGIGRFFWLKAFDRVEIESVYSDNGQKKSRCFSFTQKSGISELKEETVPEKSHLTSVKLIGFKDDYRKQPSSYKTTAKIAQRILEHCLSYFINQSAPSILVVDEDERISLNEKFNEISENITTEEVLIENEVFKISHLKLYETHNKMHSIILCANSRAVTAINIGNILGTSAHFDEDKRKFVYSAFVSGKYLDANVDSCRTEFNIPLKVSDLPLGVSNLPMERIHSEVIELSKQFLSTYLLSILSQKREITTEYVNNKNPTLRAVLHYCPEIYDEIEPNTSEEKIDEVLYKHKGRAEFQIRKQSAKLLKTQSTSVEEIKDEFEKINSKIELFQKDQLTAYVLFRKMIIDLLDKNLGINKDSKYSNEDILHDIVFPRKANSEQLDYNDHNMWLIDERLTFHAFATSDNRLCDTTTSDSEERPDILTFSEVDEDRVARSVSIIEFKKPQRKNFDEDPTRQLYRYVRKIKGNDVKLPSGRDLKVNDTTRYYCYAICDITKPIKEYAENNNYAQLKGEFGYYSYNRILNAHTEIIAFDKIIVDAKQRHKAFFEKLGIG